MERNGAETIYYFNSVSKLLSGMINTFLSNLPWWVLLLIGAFVFSVVTLILFKWVF